jgi:glycosyltransferase involved in cell wall biosynthesis
VARLRGAAETGHDFAEIVGIEIAEADAEYAWEFAKSDGRFERNILFPRQSYHRLSPRLIRTAVSGTLKRLNPHVVAVNGWSAVEARAALLWARSNKRAIILMSETKQDDSKRVWWKELPKRHIVSKFDAALVGGEKQKEYLITLGMSAGSIFLGYDVVDNAHFRIGAAQSRIDDAKLRSQFRLPKNYFFCCTRLLPRKNVDGMLRGYASYRAQTEEPWDLVVAGSGPELAKLKAIEVALGLEGVHWTGFIQYGQLPVYYGLASAFIHPAKAEAWGLVVNEAAASGLPLLVSITVGARYELVEHGSNGFLFNPNDPQAICDALLRTSTADDSALAKMRSRSSEIAGKWAPDRFGTGLLSAVELSMKQANAR